MKRWRSKIQKIWSYNMHDSLRRNASFLIMAQMANAGLTFVFWMLCARLFHPSDIGLATGIISLGSLIATIANLGLSNTVIRHLAHTDNPRGVLLAAIYAVSLMSLATGIVACVVLNVTHHQLAFVTASPHIIILFLLFIICTALLPVIDSGFIAARRASYIFVRTLIANAPKIVVPFFVVGLGVIGILSTYIILTVIGVVIGLSLLLRAVFTQHRLRPSFTLIWQHRQFALGNYLGGLVGVLPTTILPLIILTKLGAAEAAYFYIPMQFATFINLIASSTSQALFSEASANEGNPERQLAATRNALIHLARLLTPVVALLIVVGWPLLHIYGNDYASHGYGLLVLLAISSFFVALCWIGDTWLNIQRRMKAYFAMNAVNALLVVALAYVFAGNGLFAVGVAWLAAQALTVVIYVALILRGKRVSAFRFLRGK